MKQSRHGWWTTFARDFLALVATVILIGIVMAWAFPVSAKTAESLPVFHTPPVFGPYRVAHVVRVVDGDTYDMQVAVFPSYALHGAPDLRTVRVRLRGGDTPEVRRGPPCEREAGKQATERAKALFAESQVTVIHDLEPDGLGRMLATVYVKGPDGVARNVALVLRKEGLAKEWTAGYQPWC